MYADAEAAYGTPDFWGRYLGGETCGMSADDVTFLHERGVEILAVDQDFFETPSNLRLVGYTSGRDSGEFAAQKATELGIRPGVALFANIEGDAVVDAEWIQGWFEGIAGSSYVAGYYAKARDDGRSDDFESSYCSAVADLNSAIGSAVIWSNTPSPGRTSKAERPEYGPDVPPCEAGRVLFWQYGLAGEGGVQVDTNEAADGSQEFVW